MIVTIEDVIRSANPMTIVADFTIMYLSKHYLCTSYVIIYLYIVPTSCTHWDTYICV